jgi:hypothetical protein
MPLLRGEKADVMFLGDPSDYFCFFIRGAAGYLTTFGKSGEYFPDLIDDMHSLFFCQLEFLELYAYMMIKVQFSVIEQAARRIGVAIRNGNISHSMTFKTDGGE